MWQRLAGWVLKFRLPLLLLLLAGTIVMGYYASKVELSYEYGSAIPRDNPEFLAYQKFRQQFGEDGNMMVLGVQTDQFFKADFFNDYVQLNKDIKKVSAVENCRWCSCSRISPCNRQRWTAFPVYSVHSLFIAAYYITAVRMPI
jgi:predicted RND superfamily exporter protein